MKSSTEKLTKAVRSASLILAAAGTTVGLTLTAPAVAQAQANVSVSCDASGQTLFSPGVQLIPLPQQITYRGREEQCNDTSGYGVSAAKITANFQNVIASCLAGGMRTGNGSGTIEWTLGNGLKVRSQVQLTIDRTVLHTASASGYISQGPFAGQGFSAEITTDLVSGAAKCTLGALLGGIKEAPFTGHFSVG